MFHIRTFELYLQRGIVLKRIQKMSKHRELPIKKIELNVPDFGSNKNNNNEQYRKRSI